MKSVRRNITILTFGDRRDFDEYGKFNREKKTFIKNGFDYLTLNYKNILKNKFPEIKTKKVIIFLFFPFDYWNRNIEHKHYKGIYGNRIFYNKFAHFWAKINGILARHLSNKDILLINNPLLSGRYRDKKHVKLKLSRARIPNPRLYQTKQAQGIHNLLAKGNSLFLKARYGSMGKGITYLNPLNWQTNFHFKSGKIIGRRADCGWRFRDVTANSLFLRKLIKKDILIEKAVDCLILEKKKVDLRIYTFLKQAIYIYPKTNYPQKITTNISQGGKGSPDILKFIPKPLVARAKNLAIRTARLLNLDLAGIDVVLDRNRKDAYIVDVNVFPGFPRRRTFNLVRCIIKELARLDNKGGLRFEKSSSI